MLVTCNGAAVLELRLSMPRVGVWYCELVTASETDLPAAVSIKDDDLEFIGTRVRSETFSGRTRARIVGGAGKLQTVLDARNYVGVSARAIATDVLSAAGETLDSSTDAAALTRTLTYWTRTQASAGRALTTLTEAIGASWRVLANGKVWLGADKFPEQKITAHELDRWGDAGLSILSPEKMDLRPGVTFAGRQVSRVEHVVTGGQLRTTYWEQ